MRRTEVFMMAVVAYVLVFPVHARAYLDPSTGSMVLQVAIGGLLTALAAIRFQWSRIKGLFQRTRNAENPKSES